jgi:hypothetical protein
MSSFGPISYNIDINQLGASQFPRFSISQPTPYQDGLVEDVILNELHPEYAADGSNVGMVQVRFIPSDRGLPKEKLNWAAPLDSSIREYPLKNELVLVFYSLGRLFYTRRINSTNKITESSWPGLSQRFSPTEPSQNRSDAAQLAAQGGTSYRPWGTQQQFTLGDEFSENPTVRMVRPNEGDLIVQGRFGNIIRFGSSLFSNPNVNTPQPNILLTVGQSPNKITSIDINRDGTLENVVGGVYGLAYEDINKDKSTIWMVTDEEVGFQAATLDSPAHLRSSENPNRDTYVGAQIFINSDRLILNSKINEISLFSKTEINLSAVQSITVDSQESVIMTANKDIKLQSDKDVFIKGRTVSIVSSDDISYGTSGNYSISGRKIFIGSGGHESQPMVLGGELSVFLKRVVQALQDITVSFVPSPTAAVSSARLATTLTLLTTDIARGKGASFNSTSNFTSKTND